MQEGQQQNFTERLHWRVRREENIKEEGQMSGEEG